MGEGVFRGALHKHNLELVNDSNGNIWEINKNGNDFF